MSLYTTVTSVFSIFILLQPVPSRGDRGNRGVTSKGVTSNLKCGCNVSQRSQITAFFQTVKVVIPTTLRVFAVVTQLRLTPSCVPADSPSVFAHTFNTVNS